MNLPMKKEQPVTQSQSFEDTSLRRAFFIFLTGNHITLYCFFNHICMTGNSLILFYKKVSLWATAVPL